MCLRCRQSVSRRLKGSDGLSGGTVSMKRSYCGFIAGAWLVGGSAVGAATSSHPARLPESDTKQIASLACGDPAAADSMVGTSSAKTPARITVAVSCLPHGALGRSPLARVTTCSNARGAWRCEAGEEAILVTLPNAAVVPVVAKGLPPLQAVVLITAASKQIVPPFHTPAASMMKGQCRISPHPKPPAPDMQQFDIQCTGTSMLLTKQCWTGGCRYFIPQGEGY